MKALVTGIALVLTLSAPALAQADLVCDSQYLLGGEWSMPEETGVSFMTGGELNRATGSSEFREFQPYAVLVSSIEQPTIIELEGAFPFQGRTLSARDVAAMFATHRQVEGLQMLERRVVRWRFSPKQQHS